MAKNHLILAAKLSIKKGEASQYCRGFHKAYLFLKSQIAFLYGQWKWSYWYSLSLNNNCYSEESVLLA